MPKSKVNLQDPGGEITGTGEVDHDDNFPGALLQVGNDFYVFQGRDEDMVCSYQKTKPAKIPAKQFGAPSEE